MIINLTQHQATPDQIEAGVVDLPPDQRAALTELLTFRELTDAKARQARAAAIADLAAEQGHGKAMLGGAPWLIAPLEAALISRGIVPLYSFSVRQSEEVTLPDGSVQKVSVHRHLDFI